MSIHRFTSSQRYQVADGWNVIEADGRESRTRTYRTVIADLELSIDVEALMRRLGAKAVKNKSGKSAAFEGLIKCRKVKERDA